MRRTSLLLATCSSLALSAFAAGSANANAFTPAPGAVMKLEAGDTISLPTKIKDGNNDGMIVAGKNKMFDVSSTLRFSVVGVTSLKYMGLSGGKYIYAPVGLASTAPVVINNTTIAAPNVTTAPVDFGSNGSWNTHGAPHSNIHIIRAADVIVFGAANDTPQTISDAIIDKARNFVVHKTWGYAVNNVTIKRVVAQVAKFGIKPRNFDHNWVISDVRLEGPTTPITNKGDIPVGIGMQDDAHHITVERAELKNFKTNYGSGYANGDGLSTERRNHHITLSNVWAHDNSDGGFDLKSTDTVLDNVRASNNGHYGLRIWGTGQATTVTLENNGWGQLWIGNSIAAPSNWHIKKLIVKSTDPTKEIIHSEKKTAAQSGTLIIDECDFTGVAKGTPIIQGPKENIKLGKGCTL